MRSKTSVINAFIVAYVVVLSASTAQALISRTDSTEEDSHNQICCASQSLFDDPDFGPAAAQKFIDELCDLDPYDCSKHSFSLE